MKYREYRVVFFLIKGKECKVTWHDKNMSCHLFIFSMRNIYFQYAKYSVNFWGWKCIISHNLIFRKQSLQVRLAQPNCIWRFQNANVQYLLDFFNKTFLYSRYINSLYHKAYCLAYIFLMNRTKSAEYCYYGYLLRRTLLLASVYLERSNSNFHQSNFNCAY